MHTQLNTTHNSSLVGSASLDASLDTDEEGKDARASFPPSVFPAWVPSVVVALAMLTFLAISFYLRHRKVMKKRELLMDYFYIIFQYGGLRRKRMVAALCNTNAITLRELGRSFMISFDSVNNPENSCPFFLEDNSAFDGSQNFHTNAQKKTFFNRTMINSKKYRMPFRRSSTRQHSDENQSAYPVSFHDILMKFKSKRPPPVPPSTPCLRPRSPNTYELQGSSMCTIHGDDFDYQKYMEENEINSPVFYRRMRRNAYVPQPGPSQGCRFADLVTEVGRHSLGNVFHDSLMGDSNKRYSEPFEHQGPGGVFQVYGDHLTPPGTSPAYGKRNEPTILVHSASTDWANDGNGWTELPGPSGEGGVVFVRRLSKVDAGPNEYSYSHESTPQLGRANRANLSKVSYVQSGNMNEYYNCLQRGADKSSRQTSGRASPTDTSGQNTPTQDTEPGPSCHKRGRLSLGEIAVSNLNRRIDLTSESLKEYYPDLSPERMRAADQEKSELKSKTRWTRFKNVFSGSRPSSSKSSSIPSTHSSGKSRTYMPPLIDDRTKRRDQSSTRWQKFVNVFTGFRSLPDEKSSELQHTMPSGSKSYPAGLNMHQLTSSSNDRPDHIDLFTQSEDLNDFKSDIGAHLHAPYRTETDLGYDLETNERPQRYSDASPRARHIYVPPEERSPGRLSNRRFRSVVLAYKATQQISHTRSKRYRKRYDSVTGSSQSLSHISNLELDKSPFRRVYEKSPLAREDAKRFETPPSYVDNPNFRTPGRPVSSHTDDSVSAIDTGSTEYFNDKVDGVVNAFPRNVTYPLLPDLPQQKPSAVDPDSSNPYRPLNALLQKNEQASLCSPDHVYLDIESEGTTTGCVVALKTESSSSGDSASEQVSRSLLPHADSYMTTVVSPPWASVTQGLLSPDSCHGANSSESIYYDSLSSPVGSPRQRRPSPQRESFKYTRPASPLHFSFPEQRSLKERRTKTPLELTFSEPLWVKADRATLSVENSYPRLTTHNNRLASPDLRQLRRRSEELRPRKRSQEKDHRRRSAISNVSSIGSSLLTSTEVILVPMTISAPDSPASSRAASPINELPCSVHHAQPNDEPNSLELQVPSEPTDKPFCPQADPDSVRSNPSGSSLAGSMVDVTEKTSSDCQELRRKSDTLLIRPLKPSPLTSMPGCRKSPPSTWTSATAAPRPVDRGRDPALTHLYNTTGRSTPGEDTTSADASTPSHPGRQSRLLRQTSQDGNKLQLVPSPNWELRSETVEELPEHSHISPESTATFTSPSPPVFSDPTASSSSSTSPLANAPSLLNATAAPTTLAENKAGQAESTIAMADTTVPTGYYTERICTYDTLI
ncbi:hypothetical protein PoB_001728500 [Plakobranchus ocellatus]|uniref:Uncharacterized protein n=1 Tax=Plakobranchus ocellatus TaxID=259542 RepID=A0AAV3Z6M3_9GAST|nr:hypothetical protein PoB_001728500 [Plakobranchus ocellatus]